MFLQRSEFIPQEENSPQSRPEELMLVTSAIFHFRHLFHRVTANSMNTSC